MNAHKLPAVCYINHLIILTFNIHCLINMLKLPRKLTDFTIKMFLCLVCWKCICDRCHLLHIKHTVPIEIHSVIAV